MTASTQKRQALGLPPTVWAVLWVGTYFGVRSVLESALLTSDSARIALAVLPVPVVALTGLALLRHARQLDEMQARIQLMALATAFALAVLLLMLLALLERAVPSLLASQRLTDLWAMLPMTYFVGLAYAKSRFES